MRGDWSMKKFHKRQLFLGGLVAALCCVLYLTGVYHFYQAEEASVSQKPLPIYSVEIPEKKAALGINCAWDDKDIGIILETLRKKNVKATFFLVGSFCRHYPQAVKQIADEGHELASHSNTHPDMAKLSREEILKQLWDSQEAIHNACGQTVHLFRSPSGSYNDLVVKTVRNEGWEIVQWDNDTLDWKGCEAPALIENGTKNLRNGSILLLHAGAKHPAEALPGLIDAIRSKGYELDTIGNLLLPEPYFCDHTGRQYKAGSRTN